MNQEQPSRHQDCGFCPSWLGRERSLPRECTTADLRLTSKTAWLRLWCRRLKIAGWSRSEVAVAGECGLSHKYRLRRESFSTPMSFRPTESPKVLSKLRTCVRRESLLGHSNTQYAFGTSFTNRIHSSAQFLAVVLAVISAVTAPLKVWSFVRPVQLGLMLNPYPLPMTSSCISNLLVALVPFLRLTASSRSLTSTPLMARTSSLSSLPCSEGQDLYVYSWKNRLL